jgi:adenosylhomocysteine nucleosidase
MIAIIAAMPEEIDFYLSQMKKDTEISHAGVVFHKGTLCGKEISVAACGIGKVNAAMCAQLTIDRFSPDVLIHSGVAGGLAPDVSPLDLVVAESLVEHDMDATYFGDPLGQIPRMEQFDFPCDRKLIEYACESAKEAGAQFRTGLIASGDQFVAEHEKADFLFNHFHACACEMEGAAIAHVCCLNQVPYVVIRAISDNARTGASMQYEQFLHRAAEISAQTVMGILKRI